VARPWLAQHPQAAMFRSLHTQLLGCVLLPTAAAPFCTDTGSDCSGHGACVSGGSTCACDQGYEGERCDVWRGGSLAGASRVAGVRWLNCTHGLAAGGGEGATIVAYCDMHNKSVCEAAGAPTVPPPGWNELCYTKPTKPKSPQASWNCPVFEGVGVVVKGVSGSFCAKPCMTLEESSCVGCPDDACQVKNKSTGQCSWCAAGCKDDGEIPSAPCSPQQRLHCPCSAPPDKSGQPVLARPQCVVTDCGDGGLTVKSLQRQPLCALTCDPDAAVPPGRSKCQPGATCERVPNASFSPSGLW
jgi:hypothetical protein